MTFARRCLFGITLLPLLSVTGRALDWKATTLAVTTAPFQTEQEVIFEFENHSDKPVIVRELETSCSCLLAKSDLKIYPPGSWGKITARFTVGDRGGLYQRTVTVVTDEAESPVYLQLKIDVPEVASLTPRSVAWRFNEEPVEKTVDLSASAGVEIIFSSAQPTSDAYTVRLERIETGKLYRLHIKPRTTDQPISAAIRITGRSKSGHEVLISAYASVTAAQR